MDIAIQIPYDAGRALMARGADVTRAVLEAAQVQEMLGFRSCWDQEFAPNPVNNGSYRHAPSLLSHRDRAC